MLRMLEEHKISKDIALPQGILLQFQVPIVDANKGNDILTSKIVMRITPMTREGDKLIPLEWPIFPEFCPDLYGHERSVDLDTSANASTQPVSSLEATVSFDKDNSAQNKVTEGAESNQESSASKETEE